MTFVVAALSLNKSSKQSKSLRQRLWDMRISDCVLNKSANCWRVGAPSGPDITLSFHSFGSIGRKNMDFLLEKSSVNMIGGRGTVERQTKLLYPSIKQG